jgi:hypothetical protein
MAASYRPQDAPTLQSRRIRKASTEMHTGQETADPWMLFQLKGTFYGIFWIARNQFRFLSKQSRLPMDSAQKV